MGPNILLGKDRKIDIAEMASSVLELFFYSQKVLNILRPIYLPNYYFWNKI